jgi:predicted O-methyltransferase YrrM
LLLVGHRRRFDGSAMERALRNIVRNALRSGYVGEMLHKVYLRADSLLRREDRAAVRDWCNRRAESVEAFARSRDADLWEEALGFEHEFAERSARRLRELGVSMGGGGHTSLVYFLTRWRRPEAVVETGVAAGYTTAAILTAMSRNQFGMLRSSDFPYFRLEQPERFIGCLVDPELKSRWRLWTKGDRKNLPLILSEVSSIDFFHYDSDKSYPGRRWAMDRVSQRLREGGIVLMDDINDNWFFRDYVERRGEPFRVFEYQGKYTGLMGL